MSNKSDQDELDQLDGIGKVFAKALYQSGVYTFADLAAYTPDRLSQTIEEKTGLKVSADRIEAKNWIGQAKTKAAEAETEQPHAQSSNPAKSPWQQQAGFSFFFDYLLTDQEEKRWRTRYFHEESNVETSVESLDLNQITQYIREKADIPFDEIVPPAAPPDSVIEETAVRIQKIDAETKLVADSSEHEVVVDVTFEITGGQAPAMTENRYPFVLKLNLVNDVGHEIEDEISIESTLEPGVYSYQKQRTFAVPHKIGRYQIQSALTLNEPTPIETSKSGPILKVTE